MQFAAKAAAASMFLRKRMSAASADEASATAFLLMATARDLGLPPTTATSGMYVIQGSVVLSSHLYGALVRKSGKASVKVEEGDGWCEVTMTRNDNGDSYKCRWDRDRAKAAKLAGKDNWVAYEANMLRARAMSECAKVVLPDVVFGLYTPDDFGFTDDQVNRGEHAARVVHVDEEATPIGEDADSLIRTKFAAALEAGADEAKLVADLNAIRDSEKNGERRPPFSTLSKPGVRACLRMIEKAVAAVPAADVMEGDFEPDTDPTGTFSHATEEFVTSPEPEPEPWVPTPLGAGRAQKMEVPASTGENLFDGGDA